MKEINELLSWLKTEHNYRQYKQKYEHPYLFKTLLQKTVESKDVCETNDKLSIDISLSVFDIGHSTHKSIEIEIVAEKNNKWWKLSCYGLSVEEMKTDLLTMEETLINLFNAI